MDNTSPESTVVEFQMNAERLQRTQLAKQIKQDATRHLVIELDSRRITNLIQYTDDVGSLLQTELQLWRKILGPRTVKSLELHYYSHLLEPYQITGLIHRLASEFHLQKPTFRVVFQANDVETDVLALFKGLSFDHCQFAIEHAEAENLDILKQPYTHAKSFQFDKVGIQLLHSEGMENLTKSIKNLRSNLNPDYIFIGCSTYKLCPDDIASQQTLFEDDLRSYKVDYLALGPEAHSKFSGETFDSVTDPKRYVKAIESGILPINEPHSATTSI